ncbi:FAD-dependent oxidoreductase [Candidatus Solirubrobacter pratensis]|uniref:FAD-dependent oxidoreductase n=1 Tax=Candidatus Solirubrobacter pratensis TaxID=1298857 RepID=UPI0004847A1F|nr:FAD-dependent oxidoreductase [Candidatus Solirubrobacter pratensis]
MERTQCIVVGGGPAGMMLGLVLARAGVEVTVLEKHDDFLRDFRGDTVHASTLTLLDELGLGDRFAAVPHQRLERLRLPLRRNAPLDVDLRLLRGPHKHIAMVPQWDLLDMLADVALEEPSFSLRMGAEVFALLREGGRVAGVRYGDDGGDHELRAPLTVACDGRGSHVRAASGLRVREFGVPLDVWWFRLPRREGDPDGVSGRVGGGATLIMIDRGSYFQLGYQIRKGADAELRAAGIETLRERVAALAPELADRVGELGGWEDVSLLTVRLNRMPRWFSGGLLCIGDAAHAMSPVGGVGINLAVQDAVAAGRVLATPLRRGDVRARDLARVQARRWAPTAFTQSLQRLIHRAVIRPGLEQRPTHDVRLPRRAVARLFALGLLPEHAPRFARRAHGSGA